jgi:pantoate--beta-alanine ligase
MVMPLKRIANLAGLRAEVAAAKKRGAKVGLVPTMGYLHEGHLSLVKKAREDSGLVVVSVFVNPTQFGAGEDYEAYPRDIERDALLAAKAGADILFVPQASHVYPSAFASYVEVTGLTEGLCGASRPGHFRGVTTVVAKLFNMVQPDLAYFGQKDAQQALVIRRMARDLDFPLKVVVLPTVREADGLAMSSRNTYLTPGERKVAPLLYKSLLRAEERIHGGERQRGPVIDAILNLLESERQIQVDYVDIVATEDLQPLENLTGEILIALAVKLGRTRLIDNIIIKLCVE